MLQRQDSPVFDQPDFDEEKGSTDLSRPICTKKTALEDGF